MSPNKYETTSSYQFKHVSYAYKVTKHKCMLCLNLPLSLMWTLFSVLLSCKATAEYKFRFTALSKIVVVTEESLGTVVCKENVR